MSPKTEIKFEDAKKRTKKVMTLLQKIEILNKLSEGATASSMGRLYKVNESTIRYIKKNEKHIRDSVKNSTTSNAKSTGVIRGRVLTKMEKALTDWLHDMRLQNVPVDSNIIRGRALSLYDHFRTTEKNAEQRNQPFNASRGWYMNFKRRFQTPDENSEDEYMFLKPVITLLPDLQSDPYQDIAEEAHFVQKQIRSNDDLQEINNDNDVEEDLDVTHEERAVDKSDWTLDSMAEVISAVKTLTDLMDQYDPDLERSLAIRQSIESAVLPYNDIYRNLQNNNPDSSF